MKKLLFLILFFACVTSCQQSAIPKPENLIDEEVMVNIMYDISVLEALKSQKAFILEANKINPNTYIYKKYKIDSLQFANSDKFYASDIKKYKEIFEKVNRRLEEKVEGLKKATILKPLQKLIK